MVSMNNMNQQISAALTNSTVSTPGAPQAGNATGIGSSANNPYLLPGTGTDAKQWVNWTKETPPHFISYQGNVYKVQPDSERGIHSILHYKAVNQLPLGQNFLTITFNGKNKPATSNTPDQTQQDQQIPTPSAQSQADLSQSSQPTSSPLDFPPQMPYLPQSNQGLDLRYPSQSASSADTGPSYGNGMPTNPADYLKTVMSLLSFIIQTLSSASPSQQASPNAQAYVTPQASPTPQAYGTPQACPTPYVTPQACPPTSVTPSYTPQSYTPVYPPQPTPQSYTPVYPPQPTPQSPTPVYPPQPTPPNPGTGINIHLSSPLVMDLGGDGIQTTGQSKVIDIDGDGKQDLSSWFGPNDGVLAFDANHNGKIDPTGQELFGDNSDVNGDGKPDHFANGFDALRALANKYLGQGATADNKLDASEITALQNKAGLTLLVGNKSVKPTDAGVTQINLGNQSSNAKDAYGNEFRQLGSFQRTLANGQTTTNSLDDVWLTHSPLPQTLA